jgi:hypothetical protein
VGKSQQFIQQKSIKEMDRHVATLLAMTNILAKQYDFAEAL